MKLRQYEPAQTGEPGIGQGQTNSGFDQYSTLDDSDEATNDDDTTLVNFQADEVLAQQLRLATTDWTAELGEEPAPG